MTAKILKLKEEIKALAAEQKEMKAQRKTINFKGVRAYDPSRATYFVFDTRIDLNCMYAAYARLRGREDWKSMLSEVDEYHNIDFKVTKVNAIYNEYKETVCGNA